MYFENFNNKNKEIPISPLIADTRIYTVDAKFFSHPNSDTNLNCDTFMASQKGHY